MRIARVFAWLLLLLIPLVSACHKEDGPAHGAKKLQVVTTLFPLYDFARVVGGENRAVSGGIRARGAVEDQVCIHGGGYVGAVDPVTVGGGEALWVYRQRLTRRAAQITEDDATEVSRAIKLNGEIVLNHNVPVDADGCAAHWHHLHRATSQSQIHGSRSQSVVIVDDEECVRIANGGAAAVRIRAVQR
jgi:hypothetical protein